MSQRLAGGPDALATFQLLTWRPLQDLAPGSRNMVVGRVDPSGRLVGCAVVAGAVSAASLLRGIGPFFQRPARGGRNDANSHRCGERAPATWVGSARWRALGDACAHRPWWYYLYRGRSHGDYRLYVAHNYPWIAPSGVRQPRKLDSCRPRGAGRWLCAGGGPREGFKGPHRGAWRPNSLLRVDALHLRPPQTSPRPVWN